MEDRAVDVGGVVGGTAGVGGLQKLSGNALRGTCEPIHPTINGTTVLNRRLCDAIAGVLFGVISRTNDTPRRTVLSKWFLASIGHQAPSDNSGQSRL